MKDVRPLTILVMTDDGTQKTDLRTISDKLWNAIYPNARTNKTRIIVQTTIGAIVQTTIGATEPLVLLHSS